MKKFSKNGTSAPFKFKSKLHVRSLFPQNIINQSINTFAASILWLLFLLLPSISQAHEWQLQFRGDELENTPENQEILAQLSDIVTIFPPGSQPRLSFLFHDKERMASRWKNLLQKMPILQAYKPEIYNNKQKDSLSIRVNSSSMTQSPCPAKVRIVDPNLPLDPQGMHIYGSANLTISKAAILSIEGEENIPIRLFQMKNSHNMVALDAKDSHRKTWTLSAENLNHALFLEEDDISMTAGKSISINPVNPPNSREALPHHKKCHLQFVVLPFGN